MLSRHKKTHILTALLVCGMALTALALQTGQIRWMKSDSGKTSAAPKAKITSVSAAGRSAVAPSSTMMFQGPGVAPNGDPGPGFDIEGSLQANTPTANTSDWVPGVAGTGWSARRWGSCC